MNNSKIQSLCNGYWSQWSSRIAC